VLMLRWVLGVGCLAAIGVILLMLTVGKACDAFRSGPHPRTRRQWEA
jgi:hypothetical protein